MGRASRVMALMAGTAVAATLMAAPAFADSTSARNSSATQISESAKTPIARPDQHCGLKITGDGVRLRSAPVSGSILGLLYHGDVIDPWTKSSDGWQYGYSTRLRKWGWVYSAYTLGYCN